MMRTFNVRALMILMVILTLGIAGVAQAASSLDKLKQAQQRLEEVRDRLEKLTATCEKDERRVEDVNTRVEDTIVAVGEAEVAVEQQGRIVEQAKSHLAELEAEAESVHDTSTGRVAELYKHALMDPTLNSLLESSSTEQALSRAQVLNVVKYGDRETLEELLSSQTAVDGQRKVYEEQQHAFESALEQRQQVVAQLEDLRAIYQEKVAACNEKVVKLEQEERIAAEDEQQLAAALADQGVISIPPGVSSGGWAWPARGSVTSGFGYRWGRLHAGVDIGAPTGTPIYAAKGGVVSFAGTMGGYGNIVVVDHGGGMTTRYAHQSQILSSIGQTVRPGDQLGEVGSTGNSTGPHLHFEVRINDQPQNPLGYLP